MSSMDRAHSAASCERAREDRHRGQRDPPQSRRDPGEAARARSESKRGQSRKLSGKELARSQRKLNETQQNSAESYSMARRKQMDFAVGGPNSRYFVMKTQNRDFESKNTRNEQDTARKLPERVQRSPKNAQKRTQAPSVVRESQK